MIRKFKKEDLETVVEIAERAWRPIFKGYEEQIGMELAAGMYPPEQRDKRQQLESAAEMMPDNFLVAERGGKVVGFITFIINQDLKAGTIGNNAVDPLVRATEKGVGQELYAAVFQRFREAGMKFAKVTTGLDDGHAPARRAYERAGFKQRLGSVTYFKKLDD